MFTPTAQRIHTRVHAANQILLVPHQNPDGDTLGSVTAFWEWLKLNQKTAEVYCATPAAEKFSYLPHIQHVKSDPNIWQKNDFDLIVVFDSSDLRYAGIHDFLVNHPSPPPVMNIDHHASNLHYGHENLVVTSAASTTEIVYRFFVANRIPINQTMATCLLTGLITDTDHFTNAAASPLSLKVGSDLLAKGANLSIIKRWLVKDKTVAILKVWGAVLSRLELHPTLDVSYTYITQADLKTHGVKETEAEGIANFFNTLSEGRMALVLTELPDGNVKGSFRTTSDSIDVSRFAKTLGGGGHKKAAGFTVSGPVDHAFKQIWSVIEKAPTA